MVIAPDAMAKAALFPVLATQGLMARKQAGSLPEPPGPRSGVDGSGPPLSLILVGDSSAAGVGANHQSEALGGQIAAALSQDHRLTWRVEAKTGFTTANMLAHLRAAPGGDFDVAVVALGVNDVTSPTVTLARLIRQRHQLHTMLRQKFGAERILISGMPPVGKFPLLPNPLRWVLGRQASRFDQALMKAALADGVEYYPFTVPFDPDKMARDGFHPAPSAYHLWANMLARHIRT